MSEITTGRAMAFERLLKEDAIMLPQYRKMGGRGVFLAKALNKPFDFIRNDTAYIKSLNFLPSIKWNAKLLEVGGKTLVWSQNFSGYQNVVRGNITESGGVTTYTTTEVNGSLMGCRLNGNNFTCPVGHKLYVAADVRASESRPILLAVMIATSTSGMGDAYVKQTVPAGEWTTIAGVVKTLDVSSAGINLLRVCYGNVANVGATLDIKNVVIADLTRMFGAGNEPTAEQFEAMFPADNYAHDTGSLLSAGVTSIVSKDADAVTLDTYAVPAEVQALTGYGWSAGSVCNEVDWERKVYVQNVAAVDMGEQTWGKFTTAGHELFYTTISGTKLPPTENDIGNIICPLYVADTMYRVYRHTTDMTMALQTTGRLYVYDSARLSMTAAEFKTAMSGVMLQYELATPVETDISAYLTDDNTMSVESNGTLTFENTSQIPVPSKIEYQRRSTDN